MQANIIRAVERRILTEFIDLVILAMLYEDSGNVSGYDVIKYLNRSFRFLVSPGSVYSHLYSLERDGLLRGRLIGRKRVYSLTHEGKEKTKVIVDGRNRISKFVAKILGGRLKS